MVATGTSVSYHPRGLPGRRYEHVFFSGIALLILITVFVGFAHTYYLAGLLRATAAESDRPLARRRVFLFGFCCL